MSTLIDRHLKIPKYLQLAEHLRQEIDMGRLKSDDRLPSFTEMKARFDATQRTIEKAHALLEKDNLIRREPGRGVFVNRPAPHKVTDLVAFLDYKIARDYSYHQEVQRGARRQAEIHGKSITMIDDPATFKHWDSMDGVILEDFGLHPLPHLTKLSSKRLPAVRLFYEESAISSVVADDATGIALAIEHLVALGHQRIGYLGDTEAILVKKRYRSYLEVLGNQGITPLPQWTFSYPEYADLDFRDFGYQAIKSWLKKGLMELKLTAILAQNDYAAIGMIRALEENEIHVPEDMSIIGYDGIDRSAYAPLQLTTVKVPLYEMGAMAMKVLVKHINGSSHNCEVVRLPVHLLTGQSTAEPRKK